ncbi:MAG TPA: hypothetical protein VJ960_01885 [Oceanipulchritudo sp.]|nr:hypothetical protein [Oceanipulchritudo sp.]
MSPLPQSSFSRLLSRLREKLPDRRVGLAPADAFFTRKVDLPENLSWEDKLAFIELALEGNAPFPMEQLAWGFLQSPDSPFAFVYATPRTRLKRLDIDPDENFLQLLPGFISLYGDTFDKPTIRFLSQNGVLSALHFETGNPVPAKIVSRRIKATLLTDETLLTTRREMAAHLESSGWHLEDGLWLGEGIDILQGEQIRFRHRHLNEGTPLPLREKILSLPGNDLWAADLRSQEYARRERRVRRRSRTIWKSIQAAAAMAVLFLLLQAGDFALATYNRFQEADIAELEPRASRVENKLTLAQRLTQSTEEDLKPFLLMEAINPLRPDSVFFDDVRSRAFNELEIEGQSSEGVTPVNAFADSVEQLPSVESVVNNSQTRNNQTSFEFLITFASLPPEPENGFSIPLNVDGESDESEASEENDNG